MKMKATAEKKDLKPRQKLFCQHYIVDWNGGKAYKKAYGEHLKDSTCRSNAARLLTNESIQEYIRTLTNDLEKAAGLSKLAIIKEHMKLAFCSISNLHDNWLTRKEFDELSDEVKACISEIETKSRTILENEKPVTIEHIRVKLFNKQIALESLAKLMGYNKDVLERLPDDQLDYLLENLKSNKNDIKI